MTPAQLAEAILIAHQRHTIGSCLCGWAQLGKSHAGHVVDMLRKAGLLDDHADPEPARAMLRESGILAADNERLTSS
jgi:hypothetical protein